MWYKFLYACYEDSELRGGYAVLVRMHVLQRVLRQKCFCMVHPHNSNDIPLSHGGNRWQSLREDVIHELLASCNTLAGITGGILNCMELSDNPLLQKEIVL